MTGHIHPMLNYKYFVTIENSNTTTRYDIIIEFITIMRYRRGNPREKKCL